MSCHCPHPHKKQVDPHVNPHLAKVLLWLVGPVAIGWLLVRSLPRPSRMPYPCQRAAAATGLAWTSWILGISVWVHAIRQTVRRRRNGSDAFSVTLLAVLLGSMRLINGSPASPAAAFDSEDGPNAPMGTARGIAKGRVVWVHHPDADTDVSSDEQNDTDSGEAQRSKDNSCQCTVAGDTALSLWRLLF
ncbi:MAG: hypothetical protein JXR76_16960 [Deltaproteobacteria bacterium]|nr:hypothetical protein [Deltaproteobacteria bacterium]